MKNAPDMALAVDLTAATAAVTSAAVLEVSRQADALLGGRKTPGDPGWEQWSGSDAEAEWEVANQLVQLRLSLAADLDPLFIVMGLRRWGVTWEMIAKVAGTSRQAAHERWGKRVTGILDGYGTGELGGPVAADERDLA
ncbi:hypothetical protein J2S43_000205 [Catenuloplanes nepalensis]|uniref:Uncharacterized protein n=1 Tax=Catenuloplanes nepalensis TaxID=587533 RepID=A0ABT9MJV0_9ACTN|nr:hypothetical protein [Catenuloplanes nepalensis]MDP9791693.1 hypothetical protein [Catenuloplanes nepalensis]